VLSPGLPEVLWNGLRAPTRICVMFVGLSAYEDGRITMCVMYYYCLFQPVRHIYRQSKSFLLDEILEGLNIMIKPSDFPIHCLLISEKAMSKSAEKIVTRDFEESLLFCEPIVCVHTVTALRRVQSDVTELN